MQMSFWFPQVSALLLLFCFAYFENIPYRFLHWLQKGNRKEAATSQRHGLSVAFATKKARRACKEPLQRRALTSWRCCNWVLSSGTSGRASSAEGVFQMCNEGGAAAPHPGPNGCLAGLFKASPIIISPLKWSFVIELRLPQILRSRILPTESLSLLI